MHVVAHREALAHTVLRDAGSCSLVLSGRARRPRHARLAAQVELAGARRALSTAVRRAAAAAGARAVGARARASGAHAVGGRRGGGLLILCGIAHEGGRTRAIGSAAGCHCLVLADRCALGDSCTCAVRRGRRCGRDVLVAEARGVRGAHAIRAGCCSFRLILGLHAFGDGLAPAVAHLRLSGLLPLVASTHGERCTDAIAVARRCHGLILVVEVALRERAAHAIARGG